MVILILALIAVAAVAFWQANVAKEQKNKSHSGKVKPADGNKPDKV